MPTVARTPPGCPVRGLGAGVTWSPRARSSGRTSIRFNLGVETEAASCGCRRANALDPLSPGVTPMEGGLGKTVVATQSGNDGADSNADPSDPGARLLVRIGDFVEPLTRFDRSHLSMMESRHDLVPVLARQVFRVRFEASRSEGVGSLPAGVEAVTDSAALERGIEAQLATARVSLQPRLAAWATDHGEDSLARPSVSDCFTPMVPLGCVVACAACEGAGSGGVQCQGKTRMQPSTAVIPRIRCTTAQWGRQPKK